MRTYIHACTCVSMLTGMYVYVTGFAKRGLPHIKYCKFEES